MKICKISIFLLVLGLILAGCSAEPSEDSTLESAVAAESSVTLETATYTATLEDYPGITVIAEDKATLDDFISQISNLTTSPQETTDSSKTEPPTSENVAKDEDTIYENGELARVETEHGIYHFGVVDVTVLPENNDRDAVYQIVWEYHNESFAPSDGRVLGIFESDLIVTDSNGYIVTPMSTGWEDEWANAYNGLDVGQKCVAKHTFIINDPSCEYLDIKLDGRDITCRVYLDNAPTGTNNSDAHNNVALKVIDVEDVWYEYYDEYSYRIYLKIRNVSGMNLGEVLPSIDIINEQGDIVHSTAAGFFSVLDDGQGCTIESDLVDSTQPPYGIRISSMFITDTENNTQSITIDPAYIVEKIKNAQTDSVNGPSENTEETSTICEHILGEWEIDEESRNLVSGTVWMRQYCQLCGEAVNMELKAFSLHENNQFILSPKEFTERLGRIYRVLETEEYVPEIVITDDGEMGCATADGNAIIAFFDNQNKMMSGDDMDTRGITMLYTTFYTEDVDDIIEIMMGIILACSDNLEGSEAKDIAKNMIVFSYAGEPYYKDGIGYVFGNDGNGYKLVISASAE